MDEPQGYVCPCGAPAPGDLPAQGRRPALCPRCLTPLVRPERTSGSDVERGLGAALLVAVAGAAGWMLLARTTASAASWVVLAAAVLIALAARAGARARGGRVQAAAIGSLLVFVLLGEFLIYHHALAPRLVAMHREEGAADAEALAQRELDAMDLGRFVRLESTFWLFVFLGASLALVLRLTRAPPAVAAFRLPVRAAPAPSPAEDPLAPDDGPPLPEEDPPHPAEDPACR